MAAKRLSGSDVENDGDQPKGKRIRSNLLRPSFASVIEEVMMVKSAQTSAQTLMKSFEPMLRRVVNEEVERGIEKTLRNMTRSPSLRIKAPEPTCLKLVFANGTLPQTIFTCNKILDINEEPLKLVLVEKIGDQLIPKTLPHTLKVEIVVIDGDFPSSDQDTWTVDEFNKKITKERPGRRPLITKDLNYTLRGESCVTLGELEFTDNSSWIRSRRFKLGARVTSETCHGVRILEALTEAFIVKDQRGELYKKHYPPALGDEVWRLEKIGKDGKYHKRLDQAGIKTVQDFLKLSVVDPTKLKKILFGGKAGVSDRMWELVMKHAKTCDIFGNKLYVFVDGSQSGITMLLDPTCKIVGISNYNGQFYTAPNFMLDSAKNDPTIRELVKSAYERWNSLQEIEAPVNGSLQGTAMAECSNQQQPCIVPYDIGAGQFIEPNNGGEIMTNNNLNLEFGNWEVSQQLLL